MSRTTMWFLLPAALVALIAVGADGGDPTEVAEPIPDEFVRMKNPAEMTAASVRYGGLLFSSQCTMCHGKDGKGDGDLVERLQLEMPDLSNPRTQKKRTDGEYYYIITQGHGRMHGLGDRFEEHTWDLVNYVRMLAR